MCLRTKVKKMGYVIQCVQQYNSTHFVRTYTNKKMCIKYKRTIAYGGAKNGMRLGDEGK